MISLTQAKKILGKAGNTLTEENLQLLLDQCYAIAEVMYEHFNEVGIGKRKGASYVKSTKS